MGECYSKEDIKERMVYEKYGNVEIIPEMEFPAQMLPAVQPIPG